jgi:hypothetical protein
VLFVDHNTQGTDAIRSVADRIPEPERLYGGQVCLYSFT